MADTAAAQLRRILMLVPELADDEEHPIGALADRLGTDRATLMQDLQSLTNRFDDPAGFVDEGVALFIERERVSLTSPHFRRPMRLTSGELRALELGLAMLERERPPEERPAIARARERVGAVVTRLPSDDAAAGLRHADLGAFGAADDLATLRRAVHERRKVRLTYRRGGREGASRRVIAPYALVVASGAWYTVAFCEHSDGLRVFRLDRVERAEPLEERYAEPVDFSLDDLLRDGRVFRAAEPRTMTVRYSARIARWIAEREGRQPDADGSLTLDHPLADDEWAVRHVLQYGPDAEVLRPPEVRALLEKRLSALGSRLSALG
jgi:proteasome accessory factor C